MPTTRKRHTITETDDVERALMPLRRRGVRVDFGELVIRGAAALTTELEAGREDAARRAALRRRFIERTHSAHGIDLEAAVRVRDRGWVES